MKLDKYKLITASLVGITACSGIMMVSAYADTPASSSSSANASVTVSNTISLTLTGGDLVIDNLTPGNASDSNIITATITSNSPYGYHLSVTTGTSSGTTSLVNTADSNFSFANLSANKATLNDFSDNTWGYSYSTDNGTSWISGDYGTALAGYNGLTLNNDDSGATGTTLYNNDSYAGSIAVKFKIGAKSATTQAAGTYIGTVNFYAVANPIPLTTMQDFAVSDVYPSCNTMAIGDTVLLSDSRDNSLYNVGKLSDNKCWMLDNLALDLTDLDVQSNLNSDTTNIDDASLNYLKGLSVGTSSDKYATSAVSEWGLNDSFSDPLIYKELRNTTPIDPPENSHGLNKTGIYYNFCAASGGSYCYGYKTSETGNPSGNNSNYDICPRGWRMPGNYAVQELYEQYSTPLDFRSALSAPLSGYISNGTVNRANELGYWWTFMIFNSDTRTDMRAYVISSSGNGSSSVSINRLWGLTIRCKLDL